MSASAAVDTALAGSELIVVPDGEAAAMAAAARIADRLALAVAARGRADFATTGGSTPVEIYPHLAAAPLRDEVPWRGVHVWWGDDRFVPRDHPFSNVRPVDDILINVPARSGMSGTGADASDIRGGREPGVVIPVGNIHPFPCTAALARGRGSDWCAAAYADELRAELPTADGWPMFDLVLLGVGPDGHLLSVFPGSAALGSTAWALSVPAPTHAEPHVERVTLNPAILGVARSLLVVAAGDAKAAVLAEVFSAERDPRRLPAQLALRPGATWLLDEAAAADLPR